MTRATWSKVFGFLAIAVLLLGTGLFINGLVTSPVRGEDLYGTAIGIAIIFVAIPTLLMTSLFGGIFLILSQSEKNARTVVFRAALVIVAAVSMSTVLYQWADNRAGMETLVLLVLAIGTLYLLWGNVRKMPQKPDAAS